jgi:hypothetical protein
MRHHASIERRQSWNTALRERFRQLEHRWHRANPPIAIADLPTAHQTADGTDEWTRLGISEEERRVFEAQRPNVLIVGSGPSVQRILQLLERICMPPIVRCGPCPLTLPCAEVGTLAITDVERLSAMDQQLLFAWLSCTVPRPQVISTTAVPLFPAVIRSTFSDALFYRLNGAEHTS